MLEEIIETIYNNGDQILYQFFGDENFGSAKYRVINTIMFLWYEPAIIITTLLGSLLLLKKNRIVNNTMLVINAIMLTGGIAVMTALIMPETAGAWFEGEWIEKCEAWMHDIYMWTDKHVIWGIANTFGMTYKTANIALFVIAVPAAVTILNSITLITTRRQKSASWWINLSTFAICIAMGIALIIKLTL